MVFIVVFNRYLYFVFFFSSRRRHTRYWRDWSSDVCSSDLRNNDDIYCVYFKRYFCYWFCRFFFKTFAYLWGFSVDCKWRSWLWYYYEFWGILFRIDGVFDLFGRNVGCFWLYDGYGYRAIP